MIDFQKELAGYDFKEIDPALTGYLYETAPLIKAFQATLKRVGKELNQTGIQLEEILEHSMETEQLKNLIAGQQESAARLEDDQQLLVQGLISIVDQVEDLYKYTLEHEVEERKEQIGLLWKKIMAELAKTGIAAVETVHIPYDNLLHVVVGVERDSRQPDGVILTIVRCGYIHRARVIRKAQVVVNKLTEGGNQHG